MNSSTLQSIKIGAGVFELFAPQTLNTHAVNTGAKKDSYWQKIWPAAKALSQFLASHPQFIQNKKVLELGAGLGLPSLVAAPYANHVLCSDASSHAMDMVQLSIDHHKLSNISCAVYHWEHLPASLTTEVLLLSDLLYNPQNFNNLYVLIKRFLDAGTNIIISTPQRLTASSFMVNIMQWCTLQKEYIITENETDIYTAVFVLQKSKPESSIA